MKDYKTIRRYVCFDFNEALEISKEQALFLLGEEKFVSSSNELNNLKIHLLKGEEDVSVVFTGEKQIHKENLNEIKNKDFEDFVECFHQYSSLK